MTEQDDLGFDYRLRSSGEVVISRHGAAITTLRGRQAERFRRDLDSGKDTQQVMARVTGNYRRGNERRAGDHPRKQ